jgi:(1->4)-alpha-D-glucan 1-alpha-D-glucosylmutase
VLSELASGWRMTLRRWSRMNRADPAPSRSDEYHFYQALVAVWPGASSPELVERLKAYMLKAAREAKEHTSWINPDTDYEAVLERFVQRTLGDSRFIEDVNGTVAQLMRLGLLVGLSQALVKVASPGVPDYYQGTELWDFSLVDPDNRRPVDYALRRKLLGKSNDLADGGAKLHVIRKGLELRRKFPRLFHGAKYTPLYADGGREENVIAFQLSDGASSIVAVAPRLFARLPDGAERWGEARLRVDEGEYQNVLTGESHRGAELRLADLLVSFPVALLVRK